MALFQVPALLLLLLCGSTLAAKDNTYYPPGKSNPNVKDTMYWHDSLDVIQDLSQFYKLYVKFENCAYSPFGSPHNDDENLDYDAYWYMGSSQKFRANVAFSLYGVLKGHKDKGCTEATFINSFFTTYGVQTFVEAMRLNGYLGGSSYSYNNGNGNANDIFYAGGDGTPGFSSVCTRDIEDDGYEADAYAYGNGYGVDASAGSLRFPNAVSYTLGCYNGAFRLESFEGATCARPYFTESVSSMDTATNRLKSMGCAAIYDSRKSSSSYSWSNGDDVWENDNGEGGNYFEEDEADSLPSISYPLDLLKYSASCSIRLYPGMCPDPYGKMQKYLDNLYRGTRVVVKYDAADSWRVRATPPFVLCAGGLLMLLFSAYLYFRERTGKGVPVLARKFMVKSGLEKEDGTINPPQQQREVLGDEGEIESEGTTQSRVSIVATKVVLAVGAGLSATASGLAYVGTQFGKLFEKDGALAMTKTVDDDDDDEFKVGTRVILCGLRGASHLNSSHGRIGSITTAAYSDEKRYVVILDIKDPNFPELSVKADNLIVEPKKSTKKVEPNDTDSQLEYEPIEAQPSADPSYANVKPMSSEDVEKLVVTPPRVKKAANSSVVSPPSSPPMQKVDSSKNSKGSSKGKGVFGSLRRKSGNK
uniref:Uncharacterized protein n=1 Tax=Entomoneis paludosa TaxID=265537 RepID=A0A6U2XC16_9STRA